MLDAFIIEELRRREEREIGQTEQPRMDMPTEEHRRERQPTSKHDEMTDANRTPNRGVVVIDL